MVPRLGGGVSSEKIIMHNAEPKTIGTTVMKPPSACRGVPERTSPVGGACERMIVSPTCQMTSTLGLARQRRAAAGLRRAVWRSQQRWSWHPQSPALAACSGLIVEPAAGGGLTGSGRAAARVCLAARRSRSSVAATKSVEASAPHLVLRFQNSAAIITGAMAANPRRRSEWRFQKCPAFP